jgi:rSAM/selenodomain-associated transferase 2
MISVIIPTLNESLHIEKLLNSLMGSTLVKEIVVVDGGSTDKTVQMVKGIENVLLIQSKAGRAIQMNEGAKVASFPFLLFLHADSYLSQITLDYLGHATSKSLNGAFSLKFDTNKRILNFYAWFSKRNWTLTTYGDQGLFMTKCLFEELNGFNEIPLFEDIDLVRRIKRKTSFKKFPVAIITSSRRFEKNGSLKQQLINIALVTAYYLKISPHFLRRFYRY